jgi:hypothetical protein
MIPLMLASSTTLGSMVAGFALIAIVEMLIPLHPRRDWNRIHLGPNLTLTALTVATGVVFNAALVLALMALQANGVGLLHWLRLPPIAAVLLVVATLDLATYALHVTMHKVPLFWRVHRVHHADPVLDVTTAIRQHPVEGLMRYLAMGVPACILGASPAAFAVYRLWSLLNGLGEHANVKVPRWLDRLLVPLFITPDLSQGPSLALAGARRHQLREHLLPLRSGVFHVHLLRRGALHPHRPRRLRRPCAADDRRATRVAISAVKLREARRHGHRSRDRLAPYVTGSFWKSGERLWSTLAVTLFATGVVLWLVQVGFRLAVAPWASGELA